ncbi:MAG: ABC transporter permease, partial [Chloroflexi bacterium]|nr:ABC transporter permease [Chloroflexota bacterium]
MRLFTSMSAASLKMYFRNRQAIFWSLFFPLLVMLIFGLLDFDRFNPPHAVVIDEAGSEVSARFVEAVGQVADDGVIDVREMDRQEAMKELEEGDLHAVIIVPPEFGQAGSISTVQTYYDRNRPQEAGVTLNVVS